MNNILIVFFFNSFESSFSTKKGLLLVFQEVVWSKPESLTSDKKLFEFDWKLQ